MEKIPWLPASLPPGVKGERCPVCERPAMTPWTLRRAPDRTVWRRWACTDCQFTEERLEPE